MQRTVGYLVIPLSSAPPGAAPPTSRAGGRAQLCGWRSHPGRPRCARDPTPV